MNEIRKNNIVQMELRDRTSLNGVICEYSHDRVLIFVSPESVEDAKKINELDDMLVSVSTHLGVKKMFSSVITKMDKHNCILIENSDALPVKQKREFVRVLSSINFEVTKNDEIIKCVCINISAGGIAFYSNEGSFELGDEIYIKFDREDFGKVIACNASVIKVYNDSYVAKYLDLKPFDEDKIVRHVFNLISEKEE